MRRLLGLICITALFLITAACSGGGGGGTSSTSTSADPAAVEKPTVSSAVPAQNQTNVAPNTVVSVVFSNPMQQGGVDYDGFTVSDGTSIVPGTVSCLGNSAIFRPVTPFAKNTTYTVKVTKNIKDINGNGMAEDQTWSFTTGTVADITPPYITATNPLNGSTSVLNQSTILITFSEPVDPATVNATTFQVSSAGGPVTGTISTAGINAKFTPAALLTIPTQYTVTITQGVKDMAGNPLAAAKTIKFTTSNPPDYIAQAAGSTGSVKNTQILALATNDIIYNKVDGKIYVSIPSSAIGIGNTVTVIDPSTRAIGQSIPVGSEPKKLALSDDGKYLYVALDGTGGVSRINLTTMTKELTFSLPTGKFVDDMAVLPGSPNVLAIARKAKGVSPAHEGVVIYDVALTPPYGTARPTVTDPFQYISSSITFSDTGTLYGYNNETTGFQFQVMTVAPGGVSVTSSTGSLLDFFNTYITFAGGRVYSTQGHIVDVSVSPPVLAGTIARSNFYDSVCPDVANGKIFYLSGFTKEVLAYDAKTLATIGSIAIPDMGGVSQSSLIRWGTNGLAFRTDAGQVYILTTNLLP